MLSDIKSIKTVHLEVTNDDKNFNLHKEITKNDLVSFGYLPSTFEVLCGLLDAGKLICKESRFKGFRIRVFLETHILLIYDSKSLYENEEDYSQIPEEERERFEILSKREREVLCFLYRGYKQSAIAFVFGMSVHTIKRHRANIYTKTGFKNKTELAIWCEKYLHGLFRIEEVA